MKKWIIKFLSCLFCVTCLLLVEYSGHGGKMGAVYTLTDSQRLLSAEALERLSEQLTTCDANIVLEKLESDEVDDRFRFHQESCTDNTQKFKMIYVAYSQNNRCVSARLGRSFSFINHTAGAEYKLDYYKIQLSAQNGEAEAAMEQMLSHVLTSIYGENAANRRVATGFISSFINNFFELFAVLLPKEPSFLCNVFNLVTVPATLLSKLLGSWIIALGVLFLICASLLNWFFTWCNKNVPNPWVVYVKLILSFIWLGMIYLACGSLLIFVNVEIETIALREACAVPDFLYCPVDQFLMFTPGGWGKVVLIVLLILFYGIAYLHLYAPAYLVNTALDSHMQNQKVIHENKGWHYSAADKLEDFYNKKCKIIDCSDLNHKQNFKDNVKQGVYNLIYKYKIGRPPLLLYSIIVISLLTDNLFILLALLYFSAKGIQWFRTYREEYNEMKKYLLSVSGTTHLESHESLYYLFIQKFLYPVVLTGFILLFCSFFVLEVIL